MKKFITSGPDTRMKMATTFAFLNPPSPLIYITSVIISEIVSDYEMSPEILYVKTEVNK